MSALLAIAKAADEEISAIHAAFGAPGDYGYESREGKALFSLYKFQVELRAAIRDAEADTDGIEIAAEVIRRVRRTHPMRNLRPPSARELARALEANGLLREAERTA